MPVRSMRGQQVDMALLAARNSHKVALGNAGLNARGDRISANGAIVATREQVMSEYNISNPNAVKQVGLTGITQEVMQPSEVAAQLRGKELADKPKRKISDAE